MDVQLQELEHDFDEYQKEKEAIDLSEVKELKSEVKAEEIQFIKKKSVEIDSQKHTNNPGLETMETEENLINSEPKTVIIHDKKDEVDRNQKLVKKIKGNKSVGDFKSDKNSENEHESSFKEDTENSEDIEETQKQKEFKKEVLEGFLKKGIEEIEEF